MIFRQIAAGPMQNFSYLIGDTSTNEAAITDPGWEISKILSEAKKHNLDIKNILVTHCHYDHIQKARELFDATNAMVYAHKADSEEIRKRGIEKIREVEEGSVIKMGNVNIKVFHTPGHSPGSVCYLIENKLVTGDTLFVGNIGRTDLPGGNPITMSETLKRLKTLDESIEVWPGHDYGPTKSSTIGKEKKTNPHMVLLE